MPTAVSPPESRHPNPLLGSGSPPSSPSRRESLDRSPGNRVGTSCVARRRGGPDPSATTLRRLSISSSRPEISRVVVNVDVHEEERDDPTTTDTNRSRGTEESSGQSSDSPSSSASIPSNSSLHPRTSLTAHQPNTSPASHLPHTDHSNSPRRHVQHRPHPILIPTPSFPSHIPQAATSSPFRPSSPSGSSGSQSSVSSDHIPQQSTPTTSASTSILTAAQPRPPTFLASPAGQKITGARPRAITWSSPPPPQLPTPVISPHSPTLVDSNPRAMLLDKRASLTQGSQYPRYPPINGHGRDIANRHQSGSAVLSPSSTSMISNTKPRFSPTTLNPNGLSNSQSSRPKPNPPHRIDTTFAHVHSSLPLSPRRSHQSTAEGAISPTSSHFSTRQISSHSRKRAGSNLTSSPSAVRQMSSGSLKGKERERDGDERRRGEEVARKKKEEKEAKELRRRERERQKRFKLKQERDRAGVGWGNGGLGIGTLIGDLGNGSHSNGLANASGDAEGRYLRNPGPSSASSLTNVRLTLALAASLPLFVLIYRLEIPSLLGRHTFRSPLHPDFCPNLLGFQSCRACSSAFHTGIQSSFDKSLPPISPSVHSAFFIARTASILQSHKCTSFPSGPSLGPT